MTALSCVGILIITEAIQIRLRSFLYHFKLRHRAIFLMKTSGSKSDIFRVKNEHFRSIRKTITANQGFHCKQGVLVISEATMIWLNWTFAGRNLTQYSTISCFKQELVWPKRWTNSLLKWLLKPLWTESFQLRQPTWEKSK